MTKKEIKINNKLIAEFLNYRYNGEWVEYLGKNGTWIEGYSINGDYDYPLWEPNKNWNQLMIVVENIEKEDYGFKMCRKVVEIYIDSTKETIIKTKESCRIDSLYKAIIEFINNGKNEHTTS